MKQFTHWWLEKHGQIGQGFAEVQDFWDIAWGIFNPPYMQPTN